MGSIVSNAFETLSHILSYSESLNRKTSSLFSTRGPKSVRELENHQFIFGKPPKMADRVKLYGRFSSLPFKIG